MSQTSIISTNDYSTLSKYSMITKGYCSDDYLKYFLFENCSKNNDNNHTAKRAPIIHYGYMIRFKAIEYGWKQLLSDSSNVMNIIISLGSGYDTTPFRYADQNNLFIEIDHPNVCERKAKIIKINNELYRKILPEINNDNLQYEEIKLLTSKYSLIGIDLRQSEKLIEILSIVLNLIINNLHQNYKLNFILFNECSLCYIDQNQIDRLFSMIIKMIENNYPEYQNINYLGYEMYDSFECRNDFKKFMLKHFKQINAPIQTFLNEKQIYERFEKMKFEHIQIINMRKFYHEIMSDHELKRITNIEPFDEWEEFENVCQVYCLTLCKLISSNTKDSEFKNHNYINESSDNDSVELAQIINNKNTHSMFTFPILSHCSFYDKYDNAIYLVGGFGMEPKESFRIDETINHQRYAHGRFKNIMKLSLNESHIEKVDIIKSKNNKSYIDRLHCRVVPVDNSGKHFFISGGRKSPNNPLNNCIIKINDGKDEFEIIETIDNINTYRHVCSKFESRNQICQFGGISSNDQSKIWLYDLHKSSWSSSIINGLKTDRHSSAFTQYNDHSILINGGLDCDDNKFIDNDIQLIDYRSSMVEKFQIKNFNKKFYSHQMKTLDNDNNKLLIIGGICNENISNHLFEIDLRMMNELITSIDLNIDFGENDNRIVMLHNFSSEIIANDKYLMTIGGGGNCFSFGTHFNPILMIQL